jgi:hypothetical protein
VTGRLQALHRVARDHDVSFSPHSRTFSFAPCRAEGFFKFVIDFSAAEASALSDVQGEEGFGYKINAFDPNIVESRGTTAGGLARGGAVVVGTRVQGGRDFSSNLRGGGLRFAAASVLCAPKIST